MEGWRKGEEGAAQRGEGRERGTRGVMGCRHSGAVARSTPHLPSGGGRTWRIRGCRHIAPQNSLLAPKPPPCAPACAWAHLVQHCGDRVGVVGALRLLKQRLRAAVRRRPNIPVSPCVWREWGARARGGGGWEGRRAVGRAARLACQQGWHAALAGGRKPTGGAAAVSQRRTSLPPPPEQSRSPGRRRQSDLSMGVPSAAAPAGSMDSVPGS